MLAEDRRDLLILAQGDLELQQKLWQACAEDPVYWINTFCYTFDPRKDISDIPFILYPYQEWFVREICAAIEDGVDVCIEKSRDMGMSYLVAYCFQWFWLFRPGCNFHLGSRKEYEVDRGYVDPADTIFGKLRYNLTWLPLWMKPKDWKTHSRVLSLENTINGNFITGESANPSFSRGKRAKAVGFDEMAFWQDAEPAFNSASQTTPCRIVWSTPFGETNMYHRIMNEMPSELRTYNPDGPWERSTSRKMRKISLHWTLHPEKTEEWYKEQCARSSTDAIARELDINYALSVSGRVFSSFKPHKHVSEVPFEPIKGMPIYRIFDFGKRNNATLYAQFDRAGRLKIFHERVLGDSEKDKVDSSNDEQFETAIRDTEKLFNGFEIIDICDPQGASSTHGGGPDIEQLEKYTNQVPWYQMILSIPTQKRKSMARSMLDSLLQKSPNGEEAFQIYVGDTGEGCPILKRALQGGYSWKRDHNGNVLDRVNEVHPYEDVIDCVFYLLLETGNSGYNTGEDDVEPFDNDFGPFSY